MFAVVAWVLSVAAVSPSPSSTASPTRLLSALCCSIGAPSSPATRLTCLLVLVNAASSSLLGEKYPTARAISRLLCCVTTTSAAPLPHTNSLSVVQRTAAEPPGTGARPRPSLQIVSPCRPTAASGGDQSQKLPLGSGPRLQHMHGCPQHLAAPRPVQSCMLQVVVASCLHFRSRDSFCACIRTACPEAGIVNSHIVAVQCTVGPLLLLHVLYHLFMSMM